MNLKFYLCSLMLVWGTFMSFGQAQWTQIGNDLNGEAAEDEFGKSVDLSDDGSIMAVGGFRNDGKGTNSGHVRVFKNEAGTWTQIGDDIDGENAGDLSGQSVSLSADGSVVAIGAFRNGGSFNNAGHVRIYKNDNGTWTQVGGDIDGADISAFSGWDVSLSADGSVVAIGAYFYSPFLKTGAGHVRIYQNNNNTWTQIGNDIEGEATNDHAGWAVDLSADGSIVAIGAPQNNNVRGNVRVFKNNAGTWTQVGNNINGKSIGDIFGEAISLSANGTIIAIGASEDGGGNGRGYVSIYENNGGTWTQIGNDLYGNAADNLFGKAVSLSADGSIVAIGAPRNSNTTILSGHVKVFKNDNNTWTQVGNDINGQALSDQSGTSVSLSADGSIVAIGAIYNDNNGKNAGNVRVFQTSNIVQIQDKINNNYVIGVQNAQVILLNEEAQLIIYDLNGMEIENNNLQKGIYIAKIIDANGSSITQKVLID